MMSAENKKRMKRYSGIIETFCKRCRSYKPRTRNNCVIHTNLLVKMDKPIVEQEEKFLYNEGTCCKSYVYDKDVEGAWGVRKRK